jgi:hypothetical protein
VITEEQFGELVNKIAAGEGLNNEEATLLVQSMAELDQRGIVAENVVQFVLHGAEAIYNEVAEGVIKTMNLRDHAKVKKVRSIGTRAAAQLTSITQMYIAQLYLQMQEDAAGESAVGDLDPDVLFDEDPA